jgi:hypothetical protein
VSKSVNDQVLLCFSVEGTTPSVLLPRVEAHNHIYTWLMARELFLGTFTGAVPPLEGESAEERGAKFKEWYENGSIVFNEIISDNPQGTDRGLLYLAVPARKITAMWVEERGAWE